MSEWAHDIDMSELRELCDRPLVVEEINVSRIQELCDEHVIDCYRFVSCWIKLLDESHKLSWLRRRNAWKPYRGVNYEQMDKATPSEWDKLADRYYDNRPFPSIECATCPPITTR